MSPTVMVWYWASPWETSGEDVIPKLKELRRFRIPFLGDSISEVFFVSMVSFREKNHNRSWLLVNANCYYSKSAFYLLCNTEIIICVTINFIPFHMRCLQPLSSFIHILNPFPVSKWNMNFLNYVAFFFFYFTLKWFVKTNQPTLTQQNGFTVPNHKTFLWCFHLKYL